MTREPVEQIVSDIRLTSGVDLTTYPSAPGRYTATFGQSALVEGRYPSQISSLKGDALTGSGVSREEAIWNLKDKWRAANDAGKALLVSRAGADGNEYVTALRLAADRPLVVGHAVLRGGKIVTPLHPPMPI